MTALPENYFDLKKELEKIAKFLPNQVPIKDFFHQNILMSYINLPFEDALEKAGKFIKARSYMDVLYYRNNYNQNKINTHELNLALDYFLPKEFLGDRDFVYHALFSYKELKIFRHSRF